MHWHGWSEMNFNTQSNLSNSLPDLLQALVTLNLLSAGSLVGWAAVNQLLGSFLPLLIVFILLIHVCATRKEHISFFCWDSKVQSNRHSLKTRLLPQWKELLPNRFAEQKYKSAVGRYVLCGTYFQEVCLKRFPLYLTVKIQSVLGFSVQSTTVTHLRMSVS